MVMTAGDIGIEKLAPGVAILQTDTSSIELAGRALAIALDLAEMQEEINSWPLNMMVIFNCAGDKIRPEIRKYGKKVRRIHEGGR